jgi:hypothetical protein
MKRPTLQKAKKYLQIVIFILMSCFLTSMASAADPCLGEECNGTVITHNKGAPYFLDEDAPVSGVLFCDASVVPDAPFLSKMWVMPPARGQGASKGKSGSDWVMEEIHQHGFPELLYFMGGGSEPERIMENNCLGGEVEIWINGEKRIVNTTSQVFIPAGLPHGPIIFRNMTKPILVTQFADTPRYTRLPAKNTHDDPYGKKYKHLIYSEVEPYYHPERWEAGRARNYMYAGNDTRDPSIVDEGVYYSGGPVTLMPNAPDPDLDPPRVFGWMEPHFHSVGVEYFLVTGLDGYKPLELGAKATFEANFNVHPVNQTAIVHIPPSAIHSPIIFHEVDKPTMMCAFGQSNIALWDFNPYVKGSPIKGRVSKEVPRILHREIFDGPREQVF